MADPKKTSSPAVSSLTPLFSLPQGQPASRAGHQGHRGAAALQRDHGQQYAEERQTQPGPEVRSRDAFSKLFWAHKMDVPVPWVGECGWREGNMS